MEMGQLSERTIVVTMKLTSGMSNYELCEMVETALNSTVLNNSEYKLDILETKVTSYDPKNNEQAQ